MRSVSRQKGLNGEVVRQMVACSCLSPSDRQILGDELAKPWLEQAHHPIGETVGRLSTFRRSESTPCLTAEFRRSFADPNASPRVSSQAKHVVATVIASTLQRSSLVAPPAPTRCENTIWWDDISEARYDFPARFGTKSMPKAAPPMCADTAEVRTQHVRGRTCADADTDAGRSRRQLSRQMSTGRLWTSMPVSQAPFASQLVCAF